MTWTNDAPTMPGLYRFRRNPADSIRRVVEVYETETDPTIMMYDDAFSHVTGELKDFKRWYPHCQWSSTPIPEPEEEQ